MRIVSVSIGGLLAGWLFVHEARAQFFVGPSASGMGGAGISAVDPGEASFLNPASLGYLQRYYISGYFGLGEHSAVGDFNQVGVALADGTPDTIVPGALSYIRRRSDYPNGTSNTQQDIQVAFAGFPFQHLSFGIAGHRLTDQTLSNGGVSGAEYVQWNGHVGALWVPAPNMGFGFVAYDVLPAPDSVPVDLRVVPTLGVGANYIFEKIFRARLDLVRPDTRNSGRRINVGGGFETYLREDFAFRFGWQTRATSDQDFFTGGLAYKGPRLSLDYTYQKDVRNGDNSRHLFDLWFPF